MSSLTASASGAAAAAAAAADAAASAAAAAATAATEATPRWVFLSGLAFVLPTLVISFAWIHHFASSVPWVHRKNLNICVLRILLMVPLYSATSFIGLIAPETALVCRSIRDCYEALALYSFYSMLTLSLGGETRVASRLRDGPPVSHFFPLNFLPPFEPGFSFLWHTRIAALQFAVLRPLIALAAALCGAFGVLGDGMFIPTVAYPYLSFVASCSQAYALYGLALLYARIAVPLQPIRPVAKFMSIKLIIFFTYWQGVILAVLVDRGHVGPRASMSALNVASQAQEALTVVEMLIFALFNVAAFRPQDFDVLSSLPSQLSGIKSGLAQNGHKAEQVGFVSSGAEVAAAATADAADNIAASADTGALCEGMHGRMNSDTNCKCEHGEHGKIDCWQPCREQSTFSSSGPVPLTDADPEQQLGETEVSLGELQPPPANSGHSSRCRRCTLSLAASSVAERDDGDDEEAAVGVWTCPHQGLLPTQREKGDDRCERYTDEDPLSTSDYPSPLHSPPTTVAAATESDGGDASGAAGGEGDLQLGGSYAFDTYEDAAAAHTAALIPQRSQTHAYTHTQVHRARPQSTISQADQSKYGRVRSLSHLSARSDSIPTASPAGAAGSVPPHRDHAVVSAHASSPAPVLAQPFVALPDVDGLTPIAASALTLMSPPSSVAGPGQVVPPEGLLSSLADGLAHVGAHTLRALESLRPRVLAEGLRGLQRMAEIARVRGEGYETVPVGALSVSAISLVGPQRNGAATSVEDEEADADTDGLATINAMEVAALGSPYGVGTSLLLDSPISDASPTGVSTGASGSAGLSHSLDSGHDLGRELVFKSGYDDRDFTEAAQAAAIATARGVPFFGPCDSTSSWAAPSASTSRQQRSLSTASTASTASVSSIASVSGASAGLKSPAAHSAASILRPKPPLSLPLSCDFHAETSGLMATGIVAAASPGKDTSAPAPVWW